MTITINHYLIVSFLLFSIFVITIAAGEAAIGLALTISFFRQRKTLDVEEARSMQG